MLDTSYYTGAGEVERVGKGWAAEAPSGPVLSAEGSSARRCFWAVLLLLALAVLLLASVLRVDVRLLLP